MVSIARLTMLCLASSLILLAAERPGSWSGDYPPCNRHSELTKNGHMTLGVRFLTSDRETRDAFARALDFWATVLDMVWREENSTNCSMQIVDGESNLFKPGEVARSQFPDRREFQGWIAFNPKALLTPEEKYSIAVHEVGHMLGLPHNPSAWSVMYYLSLDGLLLLDAADLGALSAHHKLRVAREKPQIVVGAGSPGVTW